MKEAEGKTVTLRESGLAIHKEHPFLGASADRLVSEDGVDGLLEVKHVLSASSCLIAEAAKKNRQFLVCVDAEGKLSLKTNHAFYYQIQGQMQVYGTDWWDIMFRRVNPYDRFVERVPRNDNIWSEVMLPRLKHFYFHALLPELASPRHGKVPGIREGTPVGFLFVL